MRDERTGEDLRQHRLRRSTSSTPTRRPPRTTCSSCSRRTRSCAGSSRAASASAGARRRCPAAAGGRCRSLAMPGAVIVGDAGGLVDTIALKGVHHAINSGVLAAEAIYAALARGEDDFGRYERALEQSVTGRELYACATRASRSRSGFVLGAPLVNLAIATKGRLPAGPPAVAPQRRARDVRRAHRALAIPSPTAATPSTSSPPSTSQGNATRDDAPDHIRVRRNVPREIAETWRWMCPAGGLRDPRRRARARRRRRDRQLHQLRAVRRDHRQGRAADRARGRRRPPLPADVARRSARAQHHAASRCSF